jgi:hypothetical protein
MPREGNKKMFRKLMIGAALIAGSSVAMSGPVLLDEGFTTAPPGGWYVAYLGVPAPSAAETQWFQGNDGIFAADSGAADSYVAANYLAAPAGGSIDSWLATPFLNAAEGAAVISFAARTGGAVAGDQIEVLVDNTSSLNPGSFVSLGLLSSLPMDEWGHYSFQYTGGAAIIQFAFRYLVSDTNVAGDYIGIDSVKVQSVPEPEVLSMFALGLLLAPLALRRRRVQG